MCYMTVTPEGSTECGFMEKPGIEPATPGLQDIGLSPALRGLHMCDHKVWHNLCLSTDMMILINLYLLQYTL